MSDKLKLLTYEELQMQHFVQFREALAEERYKRMVAERALEYAAQEISNAKKLLNYQATPEKVVECLNGAASLVLDAELAKKG